MKVIYNHDNAKTSVEVGDLVEHPSFGVSIVASRAGSVGSIFSLQEKRVFGVDLCSCTLYKGSATISN